MKTKQYKPPFSATFLCAVALSFFTATQADVTVKLDGTDTQWRLTETELYQAETLRGFYEYYGKPSELVLPHNENTNTLGLVASYLDLIARVKSGIREKNELVTAVTTKPDKEPETTQEKITQELLTLADAAHYWGVMPVGSIAVEHVGKQLCDADYIQSCFQHSTELLLTSDTRRSILKELHKNSPAFSHWLIQDQIINNAAYNGQMPGKSFYHISWVKSAVLNHDCTQILTASDDHTAKLWDARTDELIHTFGHEDWVKSALFSPDCTQILTASHDHTTKLWNTKTGELLHTFDHASWVRSALFSHDGTHILTAPHDHTAKLWDTKTGNCIQTFKHMGPLSVAIFNHNNTNVLTASCNGTAKLWDAKKGELIHTFVHTKAIDSIAFNHDNSKILTASSDCTAKLWDAKTGAPLYTFRHTKPVLSAVFNHTGNQILTTSDDGAAKLWNAEDGNLIHTLNHGFPVNTAVFNYCGNQILTASDNYCVKLWHTRTGTLIQTFKHANWVLSAAFNPDGTQILSASRDGCAKLRNIANATLQKNLLHQINLEQAMLLIYAYDCTQKNIGLDLDNPKLLKVYSSLNQRLQTAVNPGWRATYLRAKRLLFSSYILFPAGLAASVGLWWYKK